MARDNVFMIIDTKGTGIDQMFHHNNKCKTHACGIPYKINLYISVVYGHSYGWDLCTIASQPLLNNII